MISSIAHDLRQSAEETERRLGALDPKISRVKEAVADALASGDAETEAEARDQLKKLTEEREALTEGLERLQERLQEARERERVEALELYIEKRTQEVKEQRTEGRRRAERALKRLTGAAEDLEAAAEAIPSTARTAAEVKFLTDLLELEQAVPKRLDLADLRNEVVAFKRALRRISDLLSGPGRNVHRLRENLSAVGSDVGTRAVYSRAVSGVRNLSDEARRLAAPEIREKLGEMYPRIRERDRDRVPSPDRIVPKR